MPHNKKVTLSQFGYSSKLSTSKRRKALQKAVDYYYYMPVIKKLNYLANLHYHHNPMISNIFCMDQQYVTKERIKNKDICKCKEKNIF